MKYSYPKSSDTELDSLKFYLGKYRANRLVKVQNHPHTLEKLSVELKDYALIGDSKLRRTPPSSLEELFDSRWDSCLSEIKRSASPGSPIFYIHKTNGSLLDEDPKGFRDACFERCKARINWVRTQAPGDGSLGQRLDLIRSGCCDPIRVFIKQEFYEYKRKAPRLIFSVGLCDNIITRLLYGAEAERCHNHWTDSISTIGIDLTDPAWLNIMRSNFLKRCERGNFKSCSNDVSGYEYCVDIDALRAGYNLLNNQVFGRITNDLRVENDTEALAVFECIDMTLPLLLQTSQGGLYADLQPHMSSGRFLTAILDTLMRWVYSQAAQDVGARKRGLTPVFPVPFLGNGDDCCEGVNHATDGILPECYQELGLTLKDVEVSDTLKFCSQVIDGTTAYPESLLKTTCSLLSHKNVTEEFWDQYQFVNSRYPNWGVVSKWLEDFLRDHAFLGDSNEEISGI